MKLIFEQGAPGHHLDLMPACDVPEYKLPTERTEPLHLPEVSENELTRHYTALCKRIHGVNDGFYPLGSCTMKYNPKINEAMAALPGFTDLHPLQPVETAQGALEALHMLGTELGEVFGMDAVKSLYEFRLSGSGHLISGDEDRWKLLAAGVQDFLRHPLFGTGLGNTAHSALAAIVPGSMAFYHNLVAQVIGSMGIVGIFAYGVLIRDRFSLLLRGRKDPFVGAMLLSYLAMLMVSMTNPGEFCPFPNAALMVMVFSMVEEAVGAETVTVTQLRRRGALRGSTGGSYAQYK